MTTTKTGLRTITVSLDQWDDEREDWISYGEETRFKVVHLDGEWGEPSGWALAVGRLKALWEGNEPGLYSVTVHDETADHFITSVEFTVKLAEG